MAVPVNADPMRRDLATRARHAQACWSEHPGVEHNVYVGAVEPRKARWLTAGYTAQDRTPAPRTGGFAQ